MGRVERMTREDYISRLLLKQAGYSQLYVKLPFDSVILYGLCKGLRVLQINELLYRYGLETLG